MQPENKICPECKKPFLANQGQEVCVQCLLHPSRTLKDLPMKICSICQSEFEPNSNAQRLCAKCKLAKKEAMNILEPPEVPVICGHVPTCPGTVAKVPVDPEPGPVQASFGVLCKKMLVESGASSLIMYFPGISLTVEPRRTNES